MTQHILHKFTLKMYITQEKQQDKLDLPLQLLPPFKVAQMVKGV